MNILEEQIMIVSSNAEKAFDTVQQHVNFL